MGKCSAFARTQAALGNGFGFEEGLQFSVSGFLRTRLVVAEELPLRQDLQTQFGFELGEIGQCGTFPKPAFVKLRASLLHADFERGVRP